MKIDFSVGKEYRTYKCDVEVLKWPIFLGKCTNKLVLLKNYKLTVITVRWPLAQISYFLCMAYKIWYLMPLYSNQEQKMVPCEKYCFLHTLLNLENGHHKRPHNLWKEHTPTSPFFNGCMGPSRKKLSSWQLLTSSPTLKFGSCSLSVTPTNCSKRRFF